MPSRLAMFDLDNTLLSGDSERAWGQFLEERDEAGDGRGRRRAEALYQDYRNGTLDERDWLAFALAPFTEHPAERLRAWRADFIVRKIEPMRLPVADALVDRHRGLGDTLLLVTATNDFIAEPIAERFGIAHLLATTLARRDGEYSGRIVGKPCFQAGKIWHVERWMARHGGSWDGSVFYSDSHNDMPLLTRVDHAVAVDPDPTLRAQALARGWPTVSLRGARLPDGLP